MNSHTTTHHACCDTSEHSECASYDCTCWCHPDPNPVGRWRIPGTRWTSFGEPKIGAHLYFDFVWCWGRATWYQQSRMRWPMERRTHYIARDMRIKWPERYR